MKKELWQCRGAIWFFGFAALSFLHVCKQTPLTFAMWVIYGIVGFCIAAKA